MRKPDVIIRVETPADFDGIYKLYESAFTRTDEAHLVEKLRKSAAFIPGLSLAAFLGNELAGHILFTIISIADDSGNRFESLALAPMAVKPEHQNLGIGSELVKYGLGKAKELGFKSVIVLGHEKYYPKFGFKPAKKWNIYPPYKVKPEVFMAIELVKDGLENVSGKVIYPKEFEE